MCCLNTMKKNTPATSSNSIRSEIQKLYRHIQQLSQRLDLQLQQAIDWKEWFDTETLQSRQRVRDVCEHILLGGECDIARKTEEYLWRKAFYDIIQKLKADKQALLNDNLLKSVYASHLQGAIGFYHHLLIRLQQRYNIQLQGFVDWIGSPILPTNQENIAVVTDEQLDWAMKACQRCLIYLGDIARYQCDVSAISDNYLSERYYHLAILLQPQNGMPHNQIGTLKQNHLHLTEACYHYMRCVLAESSFDGAEENLKRAMEKHNHVVARMQEDAAKNNTPVSTKVQFQTSFLMLQEVLFGIRSIPMEDLAEWCQSLLTLFGMVLTEKLTSQEAPQALTNGSVHKDLASSVLTSALLVKLLTMNIMDVVKLKSLGSDITPAATAFTAALLSQVLDYIGQYLKKHFPVTPPNVDTADGVDEYNRVKRHVLMSQRKRRRRRRMSSNGSDHFEEESSNTDDEDDDMSDLSEGDIDTTLSAEISEDENMGGIAGNEIHDGQRNGIIHLKTRKPLISLSQAGILLNNQLKRTNHRMSVKPRNGLMNHTFMENIELVNQAAKLLDEFEKINEEACLPAIKILFDWLVANPDVLKTSAKASPTLWQRLADVLNSLPSQKLLQTAVFYFSSRRRVPSWLKKEINVDLDIVQLRALPEDITVFGAPGFGDLHKDLDITWFCGLQHSSLYQFALRITYLRKFGLFISTCEEVPCFSWNNETKKFTVSITQNDSNGNKKVSENQRTQLMKSLAKEKLKHEVVELEKQLHTANISTPGCAYLVLDTPVLCKHLSFLRSIVNSGQFVVVVPMQVISALDDLKKFNQGARDGIKFLEDELKHGNRWLKTQKDHETVQIQDVAKKKNREVDEWRFLQIVKCCVYFMEKEEGVITLLTTEASLHMGGKTSKMGGTRPCQQALDICKQKGIRVEPIVDFFRRWTTRGGPS